MNWHTDLDLDYSDSNADTIGNLLPYESDAEGEYHKEPIPHQIRIELWKKHNWIEPEADCWVGCGDEVTFSTFQSGHVLSERNGGPAILPNLRPICQRCNSSMGRHHMFNFVTVHGLKEMKGWPKMDVFREESPKGPEYGRYYNTKDVPEAVKRRVWFDIGAIETKCSVSRCLNQVYRSKTKYAFASELGAGTVSNIKPVCRTCWSNLRGCTIEDWEMVNYKF